MYNVLLCILVILFSYLLNSWVLTTFKSTLSPQNSAIPLDTPKKIDSSYIPPLNGQNWNMKLADDTYLTVQGFYPETLLQKAIVANEIDKFYQLIKDKVNLNVQNSHGFTALHFAIAFGRIDFVRILLSEGVNSDISNYNLRIAPLHLACALNNIDLVTLLIKNNAHVNLPMDVGYTPLHIAVFANSLDIVKILLDAGADINAQLFEVAMAKDPDLLLAKTPLDIALDVEHNEIAKFLLSHGADLAQITEENIISSALGDDCNLVKLLIEHGFDVNKRVEINYGSNFCMPSLCAASGSESKNAYDMVQLLIQYGALVNSTDSNGNTPLFCAAGQGNEEIVVLLLKYGADINKANKWGMTPLHVAVNYDFVTLVKTLVQQGACVDAMNNTFETPLELAIEINNKEIIEYLKSAASKN